MSTHRLEAMPLIMRAWGPSVPSCMWFIVHQWPRASFWHKSHHSQGCVRRFQPERTLYLAFGHDEEVGGGHGARAVADVLRKRGVQLAFVLDEGGPLLVDGLQPFMRDKAVALVGTAEKARSALALTGNLL